MTKRKLATIRKVLKRAKIVWILLLLLSLASLLVTDAEFSKRDRLYGTVMFILVFGSPLMLFLNQALVVAVSPRTPENKRWHYKPLIDWTFPNSTGELTGSPAKNLEQLSFARSMSVGGYQHLYFHFYRFMKLKWMWGIIDEDPWFQAWALMSFAIATNVFFVLGSIIVITGIGSFNEGLVQGVLGVFLIVNYVALARKNRRYRIFTAYTKDPREQSSVSWLIFRIYLVVTVISFFVMPAILGTLSRQLAPT